VFERTVRAYAEADWLTRTAHMDVTSSKGYDLEDT
jgi:hypothetical protein